MMRQYELVERVRRYNPHTNEALLDRAYVYAMKAHGTQLRASGDPYFSHPLEVAAILTDMRLDDSTIVAAVLHDTIEDTSATREDIDTLFGKDIGALVDGLTKIKKLDLVSKKAAQAENLRKLLLAVADDVRVLLVKLADRLHNMRTLHYVPPDKRVRIAQETLDIYAPLAGRMGMQEMREELEELSFKELMPDAHAMVTRRLEEIESKSGELVSEIEKALKTLISQSGIKAEVKGRQKRPYSIWTKMQRKSVSFEQLSDIFGFRIIVESVMDCYYTLGIAHTKWSTVPGRFKDYISTPKQNDYRSIHTTVIGPKNQRAELQIRTREMDDINVYGVAAHALYKDVKGERVAQDQESLFGDSNSYRWLRRTLDLLIEGDSPEEFLEHTRLELFHDQVFCFTPKGQLIALPRGATPIDFAYALHSAIGDEATGCRVNGRAMPLVSELKNGDEVAIERTNGHMPPAAWESVVVTGKARAAIRRSTRFARRRQYSGLGRRIIDSAFKRAGRVFDEDKLKMALPRLARQSMDDVLAAVGRGEMTSNDVLKAVFPDFKAETHKAAAAPREAGWIEGSNVKFKPVESGAAIPIRGIEGDLPIRFAPNGGAVPGDRIIGIMTAGEGITIYPIQSPMLQDFDDEPERWLDVRWDIDDAMQNRFPSRLIVSLINEPGALADVTRIIGDSDANIDALTLQSKGPDFREVLIDLEVWNLKHLNSIIADLKTRPTVSGVERVNG
jgi:GTP diphosphokinase / guanosine-3',5'-bis(diphosphate) 3'-diphosphatase